MDAAYETFQYDNFPFDETHPDKLATIARLFGLHPTAVTRCRVLELGCGLGGNLLPLAALLPQSEFVGIDLAAGQIEYARRDAAALGLSNLRFEAMDIRDVPEDWGAFDYIICHGVYSWVPDEVRRSILTVCRRHLSPHGVAFISFNTLPGWHARGMLRSILRRVVPEGPAPQMASAARAFLKIMHDRSPEWAPLTGWLRRELAMLDQLSDRYLYFEYLVADNKPLYFDEFVVQAAEADLLYLGDADLPSMSPGRLGPEGAALVDDMTTDEIEVEQLLDYLTIRFFRRALVCRRDVGPHVRRDVPGTRLLDAWIAAELIPNLDEMPLADGIEVAFSASDGYVINTRDAHMKAMLWALSKARPRGLWVTDVATVVAERLGIAPDIAVAERVADTALDLMLNSRIDAGFWMRPAAIELPDRPVAPRVARWQAFDGRWSITTVRHENLSADTMDRVLLVAMDGTRDLDGLVAAVVAAVESGQVNVTYNDAPLTDPALLGELITVKLQRFLREGLVMAADAAEAQMAPLFPQPPLATSTDPALPGATDPALPGAADPGLTGATGPASPGPATPPTSGSV